MHSFLHEIRTAESICQSTEENVIVGESELTYQKKISCSQVSSPPVPGVSDVSPYRIPVGSGSCPDMINPEF